MFNSAEDVKHRVSKTQLLASSFVGGVGWVRVGSQIVDPWTSIFQTQRLLCVCVICRTLSIEFHCLRNDIWTGTLSPTNWHWIRTNKNESIISERIAHL